MLLTRNFGLVWSGQLISQIGDGISRLALLGSLRHHRFGTKDIDHRTTANDSTDYPRPNHRSYVNRLPKKYLLIISDLLRAVLIGFIPCMVAVESFTVSMLYVLVLLHAIATAVFGPALTAVIPAIVPKTQFTAANALLQSTTSLGITPVRR